MRAGAPLPVAILALFAGCGETPERNMSADEVAGELARMEVEPGLWVLNSEVVEVRAPGLPRDVRNRMIGPRRQLRHCITPEQAARPDANFLAARGDRDCTYRNFAVRDGRISGSMICPDARARMDGRYGPRAYDMRMEMESPLPDGAVMTLELRTRGRRIGACGQGDSG